MVYYLTIITLLEPGYVQSTIGDGERCSSVTAYLASSLARSNLDVLVQHQVTRLLSSGVDDDGKVVFNGVEFATDLSGKSASPGGQNMCS